MSASRGVVGIVSFLITCTVFVLIRSKINSRPQYDWPTQQNLQRIEPTDFKKSLTLSEIYDSGKCVFSTAGLSKSNGIKMDIYFPCQWDAYNENISLIPSLVKQYIHQVNDTLAVGMSLSVFKSPVELTTEIVDKLRTEAFLEKDIKKNEILVSSKNIIIDKVNGGEEVIQNIKPESCMMSLVNRLYYKGQVITITYFIVSSTKTNVHAINQFDRYKPLFKRLVNKTNFLN